MFKLLRILSLIQQYISLKDLWVGDSEYSGKIRTIEVRRAKLAIKMFEELGIKGIRRVR